MTHSCSQNNKKVFKYKSEGNKINIDIDSW